MTRIGALRAFVARHPVGSSVGGAAGLALVVFVLVWFQPQKLFLDQKVDEALPRVVGPSAASSPIPPGSISSSDGASAQPPQPSRLVELASGTFRSLEPHTTGRALILQLSDGSAVLRLESLNTRPTARTCTCIYRRSAPATTGTRTGPGTWTSAS